MNSLEYICIALAKKRKIVEISVDAPPGPIIGSEVYGKHQVEACILPYVRVSAKELEFSLGPIGRYTHRFSVDMKEFYETLSKQRFWNKHGLEVDYVTMYVRRRKLWFFARVEKISVIVLEAPGILITVEKQPFLDAINNVLTPQYLVDEKVIDSFT